MKKLSLANTQNIVNSFTQTYGQNKPAKRLTEIGYRAPDGGQILQAHIYRIIHGSSTCLLAPETENQQQEPPITKEPIAPIPKMQKRIAEELFANEELLQQEIAKTASELRQELLEEEAALQELERSMPPLVPCTESRPYRERRHIERDVKVSGVFNYRQAVELDESRTFYGIPCLRNKPVTTTKPYQPRRYGQNTISSRDLSVRKK